MSRLPVITLVLFLAMMANLAAEESATDVIAACQKEIQAKLDKGGAEYLLGLENLADGLQQKGALEQLLLVKEEQKRFKWEGALESKNLVKQYPTLCDWQKKYIEYQAKVTRSVSSNWIAKLEQQKIALTKAGKIQEALATKESIDPLRQVYQLGIMPPSISRPVGAAPAVPDSTNQPASNAVAAITGGIQTSLFIGEWSYDYQGIEHRRVIVDDGRAELWRDGKKWTGAWQGFTWKEHDGILSIYTGSGQEHVTWRLADNDTVDQFNSGRPNGTLKRAKSLWRPLPRVVQQDVQGNMILPARQVRLHGWRVTVDLADDQNDNIGFWTMPEEYVSWVLQVRQLGRFRVLLTEAAETSGGQLSLEITKETTKLAALNFQRQSTGDYRTFREVEVGTIEINATGLMELSIRSSDGSQPMVNIQKVRLEMIAPVAAEGPAADVLANYWKELQSLRDKGSADYIQGLGTIGQALQKKGALEQFLRTNAEEKRFKASGTVEPKDLVTDCPSLQDWQKKYIDYQARVTRSVSSNWVVKLERQKAELTKVGKIPEALAVKQSIESLRQNCLPGGSTGSPAVPAAATAVPTQPAKPVATEGRVGQEANLSSSLADCERIYRSVKKAEQSGASGVQRYYCSNGPSSELRVVELWLNDGGRPFMVIYGGRGALSQAQIDHYLQLNALGSTWRDVSPKADEQVSAMAPRRRWTRADGNGFAFMQTDSALMVQDRREAPRPPARSK